MDDNDVGSAARFIRNDRGLYREVRRGERARARYELINAGYTSAVAEQAILTVDQENDGT